MPPRKTTTTAPPKASSRTSAVRTVAPMIPLAIALLASAVLPSGKVGGPVATVGPSATIEAVKCGESVEDFHACHSEYPTGCTISGSAYDPYLNLLKNQTDRK